MDTWLGLHVGAGKGAPRWPFSRKKGWPEGQELKVRTHRVLGVAIRLESRVSSSSEWPTASGLWRTHACMMGTDKWITLLHEREDALSPTHNCCLQLGLNQR